MLHWKEFLSEALNQHNKQINNLANNLISMTPLNDDDIAIDAGAGLGLVTKKLLKINKKFKIIAIDIEDACIENLCEISKTCDDGKLQVLKNSLDNIELNDNSADKIVERSVLMHCKNKLDVLKEYHRVLKSDGQISLFNSIIGDKIDRYYKYLPKSDKNYDFYKDVEEKVRNEEYDPLTNYSKNSLFADLKRAGFKNINIVKYNEYYFFKIYDRLNAEILYEGVPHAYSYKEKCLKYMTEEQFDDYCLVLYNNLKYKVITHKAEMLYIFAQKNPSLLSYITLKLKLILFVLFKIMPEDLKIKLLSPLKILKIKFACLVQKLSDSFNED